LVPARVRITEAESLSQTEDIKEFLFKVSVCSVR